MAFKLGELLIDASLITDDQLSRALHAQRTYGGKLGTNLVEQGFISDKELVSFLAKQLQMQPAEASEFENIPPAVIACVAKSDATKYSAIPLKLDTRLKIAISDPAVLNDINSLGFKSGKAVHVVIAPEIWITAALERYYGYQREVRYIQMDSSDISPQIEIVRDSELSMQANDLEGQVRAISMSPQDFVQKLSEVDSLKDIFSILFLYLHAVSPKMAIYGIKNGIIHGLMIHGFAVHQRLFSEQSFSYEKSTLLKHFCESQQRFFGLVPKNISEHNLFSSLSLNDQTAVVMHPIVFNSKTIAVLLAVTPEPKKIFAEATLKTTQALDLLTAKKKLLSL